MLVYGLRQPGVHRSYASAISGLKHRLAPDVAISCRSERLRFDIVAFCHVQAASPEMTAQKERPLSRPIFGDSIVWKPPRVSVAAKHLRQVSSALWRNLDLDTVTHNSLK